MRFKVRSPAEALTAVLAVEGFHARVQLLMGFVGVGVYEALAAFFAAKRLLARVLPLVHSEVALLREGFATVHTGVGPFPSVNSLVAFQVGLGEEAHAAMRADKRLLAAVSPLVSSEGAYRGKALATGAAGEWSLIRVGGHVLPQLIGKAKDLLTQRAHVRLLDFVLSEVDAEKLLAAKTFSTVLAGMQSVPAVERLLVSFQVVQVRERLPAGLALNQLSCRCSPTGVS